MAISVETKDCTSLSDSEVAEMADLCADSESRYEVGFLSKQAEEWVLITLARDGNKLKGFAFSTLERIGGTPSVLVGLASVGRSSKRDAVLRAMIQEELRRAVLAFPDEDVLVGTAFNDPAGFEAFKSLNDVVPRPGHKPSGEDRAWGKRLVKRFGFDSDRYDERAFTLTGDGGYPTVFDHRALKPEKTDADVAGLFAEFDEARGDSLIAFGWAMAEDLEKLT